MSRMPNCGQNVLTNCNCVPDDAFQRTGQQLVTEAPSHGLTCHSKKSLNRRTSLVRTRMSRGGAVEPCDV